MKLYFYYFIFTPFMFFFFYDRDTKFPENVSYFSFEIFFYFY